tara:strand:+ start:592 stop:846 length:255 start_codon:yes stop_codon:yes gene_type:complete
MVKKNETKAKPVKISLTTLDDFLIPVEKDVLGILLRYTAHHEKRQAMIDVFTAFGLRKRGYLPKMVADLIMTEILALIKEDDST